MIEGKLERFVSLPELRGEPRLARMALLRRGNRLSVQEVTPSEWRVVMELGGLSRARTEGRRRPTKSLP